MKIAAVLFLALCSAAFAGCPRYQVVVFTDTGKNAKGIKQTELDYRAALGGVDNLNAPGPLASGHRSINWDAAVVPFNMPGDFFNAVVTRGAIFSAKGGKFAVSNPDPSNGDDRFSTLLPKFQSKRFRFFSKFRLFTPVLKNKVTVSFKVPATNKDSTVTGFAAIFTDVILKRKTSLTYFDKNGCKIAKVVVPPQPKGLSFAGITVLKPGSSSLNKVIAKVVVKLGNVSITKFNNGKSGDVVVVDDLFYGEP